MPRPLKAKKQPDGLKPTSPVSGARNTRHRFFAEYYAATFNVSEAALKAGYSPKSAMSQGVQLLSNPKVRPLIAAEIRKRIEQAELNSQMILRELARIAFSDIRDVMSWGASGEVRIKPSDELEEGVARAIESVTETITETENGRTIRREVKMHSKLNALDKLAKVFKLLGDASPTQNINILVTTAEEARRKLIDV